MWIIKASKDFALGVVFSSREVAEREAARLGLSKESVEFQPLRS
jgi:hypothetical protein